MKITVIRLAYSEEEGFDAGPLEEFCASHVVRVWIAGKRDYACCGVIHIGRLAILRPKVKCHSQCEYPNTHVHELLGHLAPPAGRIVAHENVKVEAGRGTGGL